MGIRVKSRGDPELDERRLEVSSYCTSVHILKPEAAHKRAKVCTYVLAKLI